MAELKSLHDEHSEDLSKYKLELSKLKDESDRINQEIMQETERKSTLEKEYSESLKLANEAHVLSLSKDPQVNFK